jgi:hypothetical protein
MAGKDFLVSLISLVGIIFLVFAIFDQETMAFLRGWYPHFLSVLRGTYPPGRVIAVSILLLCLYSWAVGSKPKIP